MSCGQQASVGCMLQDDVASASMSARKWQCQWQEYDPKDSSLTMAEALGDSLERIHINGDTCAENSKDSGLEADVISKPRGEVESKDDDVSSKRSLPLSSSNPPILICDAWYGFPTQKRPRKERINAVSRQLYNFLEWQSSTSTNNSASCQNECHVSLLGKEGDVQAVHDRIDVLLDQSKSQSTTICNSVMKFQPNVSINECLNQHKQNYDTKIMDKVVYLSPDASYTLSTTSPPPQIVIIGMLIDRRITEDRSRIRAEDTLNLRAAKLPLDELNVKELTSQEPLNVDTVMELMQRWWWNCDRLKHQLHGESNRDEKVERNMYRKCFLEAAAWAMKTQRERHPNRTVHKTK